MSVVRLRGGLVAAVVAGAALALAAQQPAAPADDDVQSVEAHARPQLAAPGTPITISGHAALDAKVHQVKIVVTLPDRTTQELSVAADDTNGDFSASFNKTNAIGEYKVTVLSPSGKEHGDTQFTIGAAASVIQELVAEHEALGAAANEAADTVDTLIGSLPASPPKEEFEEGVASLKKELAKWKDESARFKQALQSLKDTAAVSHGFGAIVYTDVFAPLGDWQVESRELRGKVREQLNRSKAAGMKCDSIDHAVEGLKALSLILGLISKPASMIYTVLNLSANKIASIEPDPDKRTLIARTIKSLPPLAAAPPTLSAKGLDQSGNGVDPKLASTGFVNAAMGWITDLTRLAMQRVFTKYCEKFAGPIEASMEGEYLKNGAAWWKWHQKLRGKLTLRYAKDESAGKVVHVSGEFVGNAVDAGIWDNALASINPKLASMAQFFKRTILPKVEDLGEKALQNQGAVVNAFAPTGFNIPVNGDLIDTKLTMRVQPATVDLSDVSVKVLYFAVSPLFLGTVRGNYQINLMKAHHIVTAALHDDPVLLDVVVDRKGGAITIDRDFTGTRGSKTGKAYATYALSMHLTNPPLQ